MLLQIFVVLTAFLAFPNSALVHENPPYVSPNTDCPCDLRFVNETLFWDCDHQGLSAVPRECWTYGEAYPVTQVILTNNFITEIYTDDFAGLTSSLEALMLSNNNITTVQEGAFTHLTGLKTLDLFSNNIEHLHDDVFEGLIHFESLWVGSNLLTAIPNIGFIEKATAISFSQNRISSFPEKLLENPLYPVILSLQNNLATEIKASALLNLPDYSSVYLDDIIIWAANEEEAEMLREKIWFGTDISDLIQIDGGVTECPQNFHEVGGSCIFPEPFFTNDWATMRYFCREIGAEMLVIKNANFYKELLQFLRNEGIASHDYWLAANDTTIEGNWQWTDGTPVQQGSPLWAIYTVEDGTYKIEPSGGADENCLCLDKHRFLYFDDADCAEYKNVICQV